jgi:SAM-dependent methyltransferase
MEHLDPAAYPFPPSDYGFFLRNLWGRVGWKALYKQFRRDHRRPWSRALVRRLAPSGFGLEVGVGHQTVAPVARTVLSDGYETHGGEGTLAKVFFKFDALPYADGAFAFLLSEHALEHAANPLKVLLEWKRALIPGGVLFLFLPHKDRTFDVERPRTRLSHLIEDFEKGTPDGDRTHLEEWKRLVLDKGRAPHYGDVRLEEQASTGSIHHHVWTTPDAEEFLRHMGFEVLVSEDRVPDRRDSFVVVARKGA